MVVLTTSQKSGLEVLQPLEHLSLKYGGFGRYGFWEIGFNL